LTHLVKESALIYKDVHFPTWRIYKRKGEHTYYLAHEVSEKSLRNFYLYPKVSMVEGELYVDRLHEERRYESCTCAWHMRMYIDKQNLTECSWSKVWSRAPRPLAEFIEKELDRILFCSCYPQLMGRGEGAPMTRCDENHLRAVDGLGEEGTDD